MRLAAFCGELPGLDARMPYWPTIWSRHAVAWASMLFVGTPLFALNVNDVRHGPFTLARYIVDGLALGGQIELGSHPSAQYHCSPSNKFPGFISCNEKHTTRGNEVTRSHSILQSQGGTAYYIDSCWEPAFFGDIQNEIDRMSSEFGHQARIIHMPLQEGLPSAVIAIWGAIQLEPLAAAEISAVASAGSPPGILVSFLGDLERSAKAGIPVYRLAGGAGFLWAATFDENGRGLLRYLAVDASQIEASGQVASNQPSPPPRLESKNQYIASQGAASPPVVTQPNLKEQSRSQKEDTQAQAKQDRYRAEIIELAIGIFVLLSGIAVAVFLRMRRQTAP
jgi:hypothetical protein